jgi:glycerate 2-kinase
VPEPTLPPVGNLKSLARSIFDHALAECSIDRSFDRLLRITTNAGSTRLILDGQEILALDHLKRIRIVSAGKASAAMLTSLLSRLPLPASCDLQGVLIAAAPLPNLPASIPFFPGGHPTPNQASFAGASAALSMLRSLTGASADDTLCIFLISGGASAMMELPLDSTISLDDTVAFHRALVLCGASIVEINCVRKHFSAVKGGRLALAAGHAQKLSLLVSDVPPAHLDALASGPTTSDPTSVAECREIIARYNLLQRFPPSVRRFFESPDLPETPKPGQLVSRSWKLLDSDELAHAAQVHAAQLGFHTVIDNTCDDWTYDAAADYLLNRLRSLRHQHPRVCLISTGEVTVQVPTSSPASDRTTHIGGRNQHFALYLATQLRRDDAPVAVLSAGSDGIDGNSPAAGAIVDEHMPQVGAEHALAAFDSFTFLGALGATIVTGPTGHNLRDLRILLAEEIVPHAIGY